MQEVCDAIRPAGAWRAASAEGCSNFRAGGARRRKTAGPAVATVGVRFFHPLKENDVSDLIVVSFKGEDTADQVLNKLAAMQKEHLVDLEDAVVAVRDKNGKVRLKQSINLVATGIAGGVAWGGLMGMLVGILFLNPLAGMATGMALGAGAGALSGALADYGIDDDFIEQMAASLEAGSSALFILARRVNFDKVLPELKPFGGRVVKTSLTNEQEARLKQALEGLHEPLATPV
jgi:uncharacterized membrane protein